MAVQALCGDLHVKNLKNYSGKEQELEGIESDRWKMKLGQKSSLPCPLSKVRAKSEAHLIPAS